MGIELHGHSHDKSNCHRVAVPLRVYSDEQCTLRVHFCLLSWASSINHQEKIFKQVIKVRVVLKNVAMFP